MSYFVTGATGFIGRHLVERLLENRKGKIHVLVRESSADKLDPLMEKWAKFGDTDRIKPVFGDLAESKLGLSDDDLSSLEGKVDHFFHLAAIYDMTADEERNATLNVGGTENAVAVANAVKAGIFHHTSSIAAAGLYKGHFTEDMFDEGQPLKHPYHRTKFESERIARTKTDGAWRVYRPAIVVGHSKTGEMDKIDGPYYFFKAIQKLRAMVPQWVPLVGIEWGDTNIVPVDFVAAAMDHIAHLDGMDGQAFHLANPKPQKAGDVMNTFASAGHAPRTAMRVDKQITDMLPKGVMHFLMQVPSVKGIRKQFLADLGIPDSIMEYTGLTATFDTRDTQRALKDSGIEIPPLESYADKLWDYWERNMDPDLFKDRSFEGAVNGKTVIITGASSGIGEAAAHKIAKAGGIPILVARNKDKLDAVKTEIERCGGTAYTYSCDISDPESVEKFFEEVFNDHAAIDILVNNAGRSIRRSIALSHDRFHDFERTIQLNYLGAIRMIMGLLPHMQGRKTGHIINISSIGVQTSPPRFSAYVASKAALDGFSRCAASEVIGDNVHFTTIHMQLVRTPMIAPTKIYDSFPTISPDEAADLICEAIRSKPKQINTKLGTFGEVLHAVAPKAMDQILHMAYKVFPDSTAAKGEKDAKSEKASGEAIALAHLMKGVHW